MPVTDSIADLITRSRNAGIANHKTVDIPMTSLKFEITKILKDQGFIDDCERIEGEIQDTIKVTLRYYKRQPAINEIKRTSKPGRRLYVSASDLPRIKNGLGIAIVSTSKGVMADKQARKFNVGGEVLCSVWENLEYKEP